MSRLLIRTLAATAFVLCAGSAARADDVLAPAFTIPAPAACLDAAVRVQGHALLRESVSAATGRIGTDFHVPDWGPGLPLYDRTLERVYAALLADPELAARFERVTGETYIRSILDRGTAQQQQAMARWLSSSEIGRRFWGQVMDGALCSGLLGALVGDSHVASAEDRRILRDWQAKLRADRAVTHDEDEHDPDFQVNAKLWVGLMRRAPFDRDAVWARTLETTPGEEEPILKALRPALMPLLPEIDAAGKAAAAAASSAR